MKIPLLTILILLIGCQNVNSQCCNSKEELVTNVLECLENFDLEKYKSLFIPFKYKDTPADNGSGELTHENYKDILKKTFRESQKELIKNNIDLSEYKILNLEKGYVKVMEIYGENYNHHIFNVNLIDSKKNTISLEFKCLKLDEKYYFRDDITIN